MGSDISKFDKNCTISCCDDKRLSKSQDIFRSNLKIVGCSISIILCVYVIVMAVFLKLFKNVKEILVFNLLISGLLLAIFYLINNSTDNVAICSILGLTMTYVDFFIIMWALCISVDIFIDSYYLWTKRETTSSTDYDWRVKYKKIYLIFCWVFPLLPSIIPLVELDYKSAGDWCWMTSFSYRYGVYYIPWLCTCLALFVLTIISITLAEKAYRTHSDHINMEKRKELRRKRRSCLGYPIVFLVCSLPSAINRFNQLANPGCTHYVLSCLQTFFSPMKGFAYSLFFIYAYHETLFKRQDLKNAYLNWKHQLGRSSTNNNAFSDIGLEEHCTNPDDDLKATRT